MVIKTRSLVDGNNFFAFFSHTNALSIEIPGFETHIILHAGLFGNTVLPGVKKRFPCSTHFEQPQ
jgi:hypothetical protein